LGRRGLTAKGRQKRQGKVIFKHLSSLIKSNVLRKHRFNVPDHEQFDKNELSISFRSMNLQEREAIAVIALAAALADGNKSESERTQIRELFSNLPI